MSKADKERKERVARMEQRLSLENNLREILKIKEALLKKICNNKDNESIIRSNKVTLKQCLVTERMLRMSIENIESNKLRNILKSTMSNVSIIDSNNDMDVFNFMRIQSEQALKNEAFLRMQDEMYGTDINTEVDAMVDNIIKERTEVKVEKTDTETSDLIKKMVN